MKNVNIKHNRTAIKNSILLFVGTTTMPAAGKTVRAFALHSAYCKRAERLGIQVSPKTFYRILDKCGYQRRPDIRGDIYHDLTFTN